MFLFAREKRDRCAQGKNREPGLQENPVRDFIGRRGLLGEPYKNHAKAWFFIGEIIIFQLHPVFFVSLFPLIC